jgi:hypothetical protein
MKEIVKQMLTLLLTYLLKLIKSTDNLKAPEPDKARNHPFNYFAFEPYGKTGLSFYF